MNMLNQLTCLVIDDEPLSLRLMESYISQVPFLSLTASCQDPLDAISLLHEQPVDLIISDIDMPRLNGLTFAKAIQGKSIVIFISSHKEYAAESFDINAVDYLVKPFTFERFVQAANKALAQSVKSLVGMQDGFFVKSGGKIVRINFDEVLYIEAKREYSNIVLEGNRSVLASSGISAMASIVGSTRFVRVHKSFIIAISKIDEIEGNMIRVKGFDILIGGSYREKILNLFQ